MKKPGKYLKFYYECMESGLIPDEGLCNCENFINVSEFKEIFEPEELEKSELRRSGLSSLYWGSGLPVFDDTFSKKRTFSELRQNMVLLLAAMNNEL